MWVEQSVCFVICEGDRGTVLAADFCYVLCHVYVFPTSEPPGFSDIAFPAISGVSSGHSTKDGVDNVLRLRNIHPVTWSRVWVRCNRRCPIGCSGWGDNPLHKFSQVAISDKERDLVTKWYAIFRLMADVLMEIAVHVLVPPSTIRSERWWTLEQSPTKDLVHDVLNDGDQWGVLAEPSRRCTQTRGSFGPSGICDHGLPLLWSALIRCVLTLLLYGKSGLFPGHQTSSPFIFVRLGMLPSNPPQVCEGRWDVVGECPD
ncbi:hypothetical protein TIFTF001_048879 [Ficus carica]|uniref:Uncharacterized protein n=1 Tax=Ficus carica TaxID=3494 RepID=A0AA87YRB1_FICCA|nr:hypothetical protein TIFTF001_048879 [Ficus carica]